MVSMPLSLSLRLMGGADFTPIVLHGPLSFSMSNLSLEWVGLDVFSRTGTVIVTRSCSSICPLNGTRLLIETAFLTRCSQFCCCDVSGLCHVQLLDGMRAGER